MTYRGRISRGCQICRERRVKCDQLKPSCTQCIKGRWTCPGYRDLTDLMFRDQSEAVIRKFHAQGARGASKKGNEALFPKLLVQRADDTAEVPLVPRIAPCLLPSIHDRAISYFLSSHVMGDSDTMRGHFEYLPSLYYASGRDAHISACINAVALASFANTVHSEDVMKEARQEYISAIHLTNEALWSPVEAAKDTTIVAVLLHGSFEVITCKDQGSIASCLKHSNGGAALLKLRGPQQFSSRVSLQIFRHMALNVMITCLQRELPIPPSIVTLRETATAYVDVTDTAWRITDIMIQFAQLRAFVKDHVFPDSRAIIDAALQVDCNIVSFCLNMPPDWQYEKAFVDDKPMEVYEGYYHIYADTWRAQMWNYLRLCRIFLHQTIQHQLMDLSATAFTLADTATQFQISTSILLETSSEICATVPQIGGFPSSTSTSIPSPRPSPVDAPGTYYLTWPLFIVASLPTTPPRQSLWIMDRLRVFGHATGIHQAVAAAEALGRGEKIRVWEEARQQTKPLD